MYDFNDNYKEYVRWRNVVNDGDCSPWEVWYDLGTYPTQEKFMEGIEKCNLIKERLCIRAYPSERDKSQLIDYGLRKQFYIPDITGWDMTMYKDPEYYADNYNSHLYPCPFCGGKAVMECNQELRYGGDDGYYVQCTKCGMNTVDINGNYDRMVNHAAQIWNRRIKI